MAKKPVADAELPHADAEMPVADAEMPAADAEVPVADAELPAVPAAADAGAPSFQAGDMLIGGLIFPGFSLRAGHRARRASWAPGYELSVEAARGRAGGTTRFMTSGGRGGLVEWAPKNLADELLADDWQVIAGFAAPQPANPEPAEPQPADPEPADPDPDLLAGA